MLMSSLISVLDSLKPLSVNSSVLKKKASIHLPKSLVSIFSFNQTEESNK